MKKKLKSHKELKVWQKSLDLVIEIYKMTKLFPKEETYGLSSQLRRASIAISSNIAEGYQRNTLKEYLQFLYIARGSVAEVETQLTIAKSLNMASEVIQNKTNTLLDEISKMLNALITKLKELNKEPRP